MLNKAIRRVLVIGLVLSALAAPLASTAHAECVSSSSGIVCIR